ncbi:MAG: ATP-binding protein [Pirellulales bacterium]|nr:ATP-binding protein [Pirellulales bacterium]
MPISSCKCLPETQLVCDSPGELPDRTVEILEFFNPWWRGKPAPEPPLFRRDQFKEIWRRLQNKTSPVVAIRGPRRVGKTTIQRQLIEQLLYLDGIPPERILRVQYDEVPQLGVIQQPILSIVRWYEKQVLRDSINHLARLKKPVYLLFDEIQDLQTWAPELKSLVDHTDCRTLITGSSSLRIRRGLEVLAGRMNVLEMGPLHLREIAEIRKLGHLSAFSGTEDPRNWIRRDFWLQFLRYTKKHHRLIHRAFDLYDQQGGFPECHYPLGATRTELTEKIASFVIAKTFEDVPVRSSGQAWDKQLLRETFRQVCIGVGQGIKPENIRNNIRQIHEAGVTNAVIYETLDYLVDSMLVHRIEPEPLSKKKKRNGAKYCLCDHFVREVWLQERIPLAPQRLQSVAQPIAALAGHVMESIIGYFLEGLQGIDLYWFPERENEQEIDYVLTIGQHHIPLEVKYTRKITRDDIKGLASFCGQKKYNAPFGLIITQEKAGLLAENIIAIPAASFLSLY